MRIGLQRNGGTLFTHLILSFTLLAVVLVGLVGGYLYVQANKLMTEEIARENGLRLQASSDFIETTMLKRYENSLRNLALSTMSPDGQSLLSALLNSNWEGNASRILALSSELELFKAGNEGVYKITAHFKNENYVVNSSMFYMSRDNSPDAEYLKEPAVFNRWVHRTVTEGTQSLDVLTYSIPLPYGSSPEHSAGTLYLDVDMRHISGMASSMMSSPSDRLFVFDEAGIAVMQTGAKDEAHAAVAGRWMETERGHRHFEFNNRDKYVLSYMDDSSSNGWHYILIRPVNSFVSSSDQLKGEIFFSCLLVLFIGLLISYLMSRQVYIPMKKLVSNIRGFYNTGASHQLKNEYAIIGTALNALESKVETLETIAKAHELKNFVLGAGNGLDHDDLVPAGRLYIVGYIRLLKGSCEQFADLHDQHAAYRHYRIISINAQEAAVLYHGEPQAAREELERSLLDDLRKTKEAAGAGPVFGAAFGSLVQTPEEIPFSYQCAVHAYRYRFLYGAEAVVLHSQVSAFPMKPQLFSFDVYKNALKAGNEVAVNRFIDDFQKGMEEGNVQLETVELGLLQLATILYQVVIDLDLQQMVPASSLFDELKKETLAATLESIRALSARITAHVQETGNHAHTEMIRKLKAFIDDNMHEDLSLNRLSEVASLAPSYISTLFGTVMNESFTEYVTRIRLEKAAQLLTENKRLSVSEISAMVGYRNPQYFHNKFKSRYGVTPVQYRNSREAGSLAIE